jgi:hypothetical protein
MHGMRTGSSKQNLKFPCPTPDPHTRLRKNIQPIDTVHTEHRNLNRGAGKEIFSLAQLDQITTSFKKTKAIAHESWIHQLNIIIEWTGSIEVELKISLPGSGCTCVSAERILEQKVKHTQYIRNYRIPLGGVAGGTLKTIHNTERNQYGRPIETKLFAPN